MQAFDYTHVRDATTTVDEFVAAMRTCGRRVEADGLSRIRLVCGASGTPVVISAHSGGISSSSSAVLDTCHSLGFRFRSVIIPFGDDLVRGIEVVRQHK